MKRVLVFCLLLFLSVAAYPHQVQILLRQQAEVQCAEVRLGDIARIRGEAQASMDMQNVVVHRFDSEVPHASLRVEDIRTLLMQHTDQPFIIIGSAVAVSRKMQRWDTPALTGLVEAWLLESGNADTMRLSSLETTAPIVSGHPELRIIHGSAAPGRQVLIVAEVNWRGEIEAEHSIACVFSRVLTIFRASRDMMRGSVIRPENFTAESRAAEAEPGISIRLEDVHGLRLRTGVREGEILSRSMIEWPLLVRRRDTVQVTYNQGGIMMTLEAEAMEDGRTHERIRFKNPASGKVFQAVVYDDNKAYVGVRP